jgi:PLP dependent protein
MDHPEIAQAYQQLVARIREQETRFDRSPGSVTPMAVSKTHGANKVLAAWRAGARHFGENYVQEALDKIHAVPLATSGLDGITWHFIGPVQSNKTRDIAAAFDWVHSVDRLKIAQRLQDQRPADLAPLNVCIQVNLSGEDTKSGIALDEVPALCQSISQMDRLVLRGLMAIPAPCSGYAQQRATFRPLADMFKSLQGDYPQMDTLSIGMSDDFEAAIAEGSTMIRVGTAIFGKRE